MDYTKEKNHLDSLYAAAHLSLDSKNILEIPTFIYQRSRRVPRLTDWIRRAVNAWGMDIGSEKLVSFSDH